ncbi:MAG: hypothetical protein ACJ74O_05800 [Frankiaceae bacterium]
MLTLRFEGYFQCRLATDPDPSDEPRGVTGATFAVAGEPDLDGVIRFRDPVAPRSHGPRVGVRVTAVAVGGIDRPGHPLLGADVELLDGARFHERNGVIARSGEAAIDPFRLRVTGDGVTLTRSDAWDPRDPALEVWNVPAPLLRRRQPAHAGRGTFEMSSPEVADATGVADYPGFVADRLAALERELAALIGDPGDEVTAVALRKRISALRTGDWRMQFRLGFRAEYSFAINGRVDVSDEQGALGGTVLTSAYWLPHWPLTLWFGGFDSDALCGFARGTLDIPFASDGALAIAHR